ncbi:MAG: hypothetical protein JO247_22130 [Chloroflexi bacterium]|nr:hypothetical protein [Chloroflexota bacterium]
MNADELLERQRYGLWLDGREGLETKEEAMAFMEEVGVALRYGAAKDLPLASLYRATQRHIPVPEPEGEAQPRAFALGNDLLASGRVIETNLVANRLALAHERLTPAIYALRRSLPEPVLSETASAAFDFIRDHEAASGGDVRRALALTGQPRPDAVDQALAELQRELLVDRGPAAEPGRGVFYLSKEGYPYRVFAEAHPNIVSSGAALRRGQAAAELVAGYLSGAVFGNARKLASMFQLLLRREEIDAALEALVRDGRAEWTRVGKAEAVVLA